MRHLFLALSLIATALVTTPARAADPYPWCAQYSGDGGGAENCYFRSLEQCRAALQGMGGYCRRNGFYTEDKVAPRRH